MTPTLDDLRDATLYEGRAGADISILIGFDGQSQMELKEAAEATIQQVIKSALETTEMALAMEDAFKGALNGVSAQAHLLLLRFHDVESFKQLRESFGQHAYSRFKELMGRKGFEASRKGGSSGKTQVNANFFKFLHEPGNLPRKAKAVKIVQTSDSWKFFYVSTKKQNKTVVSHVYTQPQPGGSFDMPPDMLDNHPALRSFMEAKILAAQVLEKLNKVLGGVLVQPGAAANTLKHLAEARELSGSENEIIKLVSARNRYTVVAYAVGFHVDVFGGSKPSLENKVCFVHPGMNGSCGRGGAGAGKFMWALLDWTNESSGAARRALLAMGAPESIRVNSQAYHDFIEARQGQQHGGE